MNTRDFSILQQKARGTFSRNEQIRKLAKSGKSYSEIARRYAMTRQAIRAIVLSEGNGKVDNG